MTTTPHASTNDYQRRCFLSQCVAGLKRLDGGNFSCPRHVDGAASRIMLAPEAFAMLTDGIDMNQATMRPWYDRE